MTTAMKNDRTKYTMKISRLTIDKLGIHMYDRVSAVLAELIANSYDADATKVTVTLPFGKYLAKKKAGKTIDLGFEISIEDDGIGMLSHDVNEYYLKIGANRRSSRGETTPSGRPVLGRKGIGKLAPFGICREIEVITAGGDCDGSGNYEVCDLLLQYDSILSDSDDDYHPKPGPLDGSRTDTRGTKIILRYFNRRRVPTRDVLHRQISARFGISRNDWQVRVVDSENTSGSDDGFNVGELEIPLMEGTRIGVDSRPVLVKVSDEDEPERTEELPVTGWVAYSKDPYKDDAMAGVRVFARGKLVAHTRDFDIGAGFTGEYKMRSYVVGEIHANWLDDDDDLIRSDRQGIIWTSERGEALQQWGVALLKELASGSETSFRNQVWGEFLERSRLKERLQRAHPGDPTLRDAIQRAAKSLVRSVDREQVRRNDDFVDRVVKLAFAVGPHETLLYAMDDVAALTTGTLEPVIELFEKASVVEMYSLGQVARERVDAVKTLEKLIGSASTEEYQLQRLIEHAPWILYPDWTPLTRNQPLKSLRAAFATWYQRNEGKEIITTSIGSNKRPDFLMLNYSGFIEIVEIKRPKHALTDEEYERAFNYRHAVMKFLEENDQLRELFPKVRLTIVCEKLALRPVNANAIDNDDNIAHKTWDTVLHHTIQAHQDFLSRVHELQGPPPPLPERE